MTLRDAKPGPVIRPSGAADLPGLEALYPAAFPEEDLLPLLRDLLAEPDGVLSLVAEMDGALAGHVAFTSCGVEGAPGSVALLGPLAVAPEWQRQGVGRALAKAGGARMAEQGAIRACVLGDPAYYSRLGFAAEREILPPCPLPPEWDGAWQSMGLAPAQAAGSSPAASSAAASRLSGGGTLTVPGPWQNPALWAA